MNPVVLGLSLTLGLALLAAAPAVAQVEVVSARPQTAAVVVYRDRPTATAELYGADDSAPFNPSDPSGLALITETRVVELPAGRVRIRFRGVAEGMLPQSATLEGLNGGLEQNYDFDLLTPGSLIAGAVGERVRRVRTNPETGAVTEEAAVLRSGPAGVVLDMSGRIEALGCSGGPERLVFERVPPGLADTPTLSVLADSPRAGRRTLTLSYLTFGLQWAADYVAQVRPDGRTLDLLGWITLSNRTRTSFPDAPLQVVAGKLNREPVEAPRAERPIRSANCWGQDTTTDIANMDEIVVTGRRLLAVSREEFLGLAPPPPPAPEAAMAAPAMIAEQSELGDYKLYTLPERVTVAARQTKQVAFLSQRTIPFERVYVFEVRTSNSESAQPATISYRLLNTAAGGLGKPLPTGAVSVIAPGSDGRLRLVGQARTEDLPVGAPVRLDVGRAVDVTVQARVDPQLAQAGRYEVEAEVGNAGSAPAVVEIVHPANGRAFKVPAEDQAHVVRDGAPVWTVTVPANGRRTLRYTVQVSG